jgi:hypothetical protein
MGFSVHSIEGFVYGDHRRGVVFLRSSDNAEVNAEAVFKRLTQNDQNRMRDKFRHWMQGNDGPAIWFHGFNDAERQHCFVFKRKKSHTNYRYYGFLTHPQPITDPGYWLCVLARHAQKNTEATDPAETDFVNELRLLPDVIAAIKKSFPDR